jgi:hypothetical protein
VKLTIVSHEADIFLALLPQAWLAELLSTLLLYE